MTAAGHPSGTDRAEEAVRGISADLVVNIQGDEPLMDPALIDRLVETAQAEDWDMATAASPLRTPDDAALIANSSVCKVVFDAAGRALYFRDIRFLFSAMPSSGMTGAVLEAYRHLPLPPGIPGAAGAGAAQPAGTGGMPEQLRALHIGGPHRRGPDRLCRLGRGYAGGCARGGGG